MKKNFFKVRLVSFAIMGTLMFAACQSDSKADNAKTNTTPSEVTTQSETQTENKTPENTETKPEGKSTSEISLGEAADGVYTNTSFGIEMSYPKDWIILDDAQKKQIIEDGSAEIESKTGTKLDLENLPILQLFTATSPTGSSIQIMLEKPADGSLLDPSKYLETVMTQLSNPNLGMKASAIEAVDLSGKPFKHLEVDVNNGVAKQHYYVSSLDDYIISIITTSTSDADAALIGDSIKGLKLK